MHEVFDPETLSKCVHHAMECLKDVEFDAIACRGNSGTLFAGALSLRMGKPIILVRKPTGDSHTSTIVEGCMSALSYVVVDDFVASGKTYRTIREEIANRIRPIECKGIYTYKGDSPGFEPFPVPEPWVAIPAAVIAPPAPPTAPDLDKNYARSFFLNSVSAKFMSRTDGTNTEPIPSPAGDIPNA